MARSDLANGLSKICLLGLGLGLGQGIVACSVSEAEGEGSFRSLMATADDPTAEGDLVTLSLVSAEGVFVCQKTDGLPFESTQSNPAVQLYVDGVLREERYYNIGPEAEEFEPDDFIVFETTATGLDLGQGAHTAYCSALPDWDEFDPGENPDDEWVSCETDTLAAEVCTLSGVLNFAMEPAESFPVDVYNLTETLEGNCGQGASTEHPKGRLCSGWTSVPEGEHLFFFECSAGTEWGIVLNTRWNKNGTTNLPVITELTAREPGGSFAETQAGSGQVDRTTLEVYEDGLCYVQVTAHDDARIKMSIALDDIGQEFCHDECLEDSVLAAIGGCDCDPYCHNVCTEFGISCDLPCNSDVEWYACPFEEKDINKSDCKWWKDDTNSYEHRGKCYRCGDGQQCCYEGGLDNGTGSFDICPPMDPGSNQDQEPFAAECGNPATGLGWLLAHFDCDVLPLCGCVAKTSVLFCEDCVDAIEQWKGYLDFDWSFDGFDFCVDASQDEFDWCGIVANPEECFSWQE